MAVKVPKFGAWEGEQNVPYTAYFDNARKIKDASGCMINPNDPKSNPNVFPQTEPPAQALAPKPEPGGQRSKVPEFGAWDDGLDGVSYTEYFGNPRKNKNVGSNTKLNEQQAQPAPSSAPLAQQHSKVPQFGAWEGGDDVAYTMCFDNARKNKSAPMDENLNEQAQPRNPRKNKNAGSNTKLNEQQAQPAPSSAPLAQQCRKVPQFGDWEGGDDVAYTMCFDNARKNKSAPMDENLNEPIRNRDLRPCKGGEPSSKVSVRSNETQMNRDVGLHTRTALPSGKGRATNEDGHNRNVNRTSTTGSETPNRQPRNLGGQSSLHQRAGKLVVRGNQIAERGTAVPKWGEWDKNPSQAEGYTETFNRVREEKGVKAPLSYSHTSSHSPNPHKKKSCCFPFYR